MISSHLIRAGPHQVKPWFKDAKLVEQKNLLTHMNTIGSRFYSTILTPPTNELSLLPHLPTGQEILIKKIAHRFGWAPHCADLEVEAHKSICDLPDSTRFVAEFYGAVKVRFTSYIFMEIIDGLDLQYYLSDNGPVEVRHRAALGCIEACKWLHQHGWYHGDLKIENFLVDKNENIKMIDFAYSCSTLMVPVKRDLFHLPLWPPPESLPTGASNRSTRTDMFSMEASDLWMLAITLLDVLEQIQDNVFGREALLEDDYYPTLPNYLADEHPQIPVQFFSKALQQDPAKRYKNINTFSRAIRKVYRLD